MKPLLLAASAAVALAVWPVGAGAPSRPLACCSTVPVSKLGGSGYPASLKVELALPDGYAAGSSAGTWAGPAYTDPQNAGVSGKASIDWRLALVSKAEAGSPAAAAQAALIQKFPVVKAKGTLQVPHTVGGKRVGPLPGAYVVTQAAGGGLGGQTEASAAFRLSTGDLIVARFSLLRPYDDAFVVGPKSIPAPEWNATAAMQAVKGIRLDGAGSASPPNGGGPSGKDKPGKQAPAGFRIVASPAAVKGGGGVTVRGTGWGLPAKRCGLVRIDAFALGVSPFPAVRVGLVKVGPDRTFTKKWFTRNGGIRYRWSIVATQRCGGKVVERHADVLVG